MHSYNQVMTLESLECGADVGAKDVMKARNHFWVRYIQQGWVPHIPDAVLNLKDRVEKKQVQTTMPFGKYNTQVTAPPSMRQKVQTSLAELFKTVRARAVHETAESSSSSSSSSSSDCDSDGENEL